MCQNRSKAVSLLSFLSLSVLHTAYLYLGMNSSLIVAHRCPVSLHLNVCERFHTNQRRSTELQCCFSAGPCFIFIQMKAFKRKPFALGDFLQHLYFWFILLIFVFSAVWGLASAPKCFVAENKSIWHFEPLTQRLTLVHIFCSPSVGSVYLLRRVEASEAVGDPRWRHLEQPPYIQAWEQTGSLALYLLHVCPRRVIIGRAFMHFNYVMKGRVSAWTRGQYHGPAVNISLVKLIIVLGFLGAVRGLLSFL